MAYEARKKYISIKKSTAGEKFLYHGTTQDNCDSIMETGFNRSFAGQNGKDLLDPFLVKRGHFSAA